MKLSTKGRYGLRAMIDLASHEEEGAVSIASISRTPEYLRELSGAAGASASKKPDSLRVCGEQAVDMYLQNRQIPFR